MKNGHCGAEESETAASLPIGILGVEGGWAVMEEGVSEAKHSFATASLPLPDQHPGPFRAVSQLGPPSLVKPAGKSAQATAAQPD